MENKLNALLLDMRQASLTDQEIGHAMADETLVELGQLLADYNPKYKDTILEIISIYHDIDKWYA